MQNIIKYTAIALISACFLSMACTSAPKENALVDEYIGQLDSLSFDQLKQAVEASYASLAMMKAFGDAFGIKSDTPRDFTEDEEREEEYAPYKQLSRTDFENAVAFGQEADYPRAELKIDTDVKASGDDDITYYVDRIYYADGTSDSIDRSISRSIDTPLKKIDSLTFTARYKRTTKRSTLNLSKSNKTVKYKDGDVKLESIDKNFAKYSFSDNISGAFLDDQAITPSGKYVGSRSSSSSSYPEGFDNKMLIKVTNSLEKIVEKIKANKYDDKEALVKDIRKNFSAFANIKPSGRYYRSVFFNGSVTEVALYMADERKVEDFTFTIPVYSSIGRFNVVQDDTTKLMGIVDNSGNILITPKYKRLTQVNDYCYTSEDYYKSELLFLNDSSKTMLPIDKYKVRNIDYLNNDLVLLTYRGKEGALNKHAQAVIPPIYNSVSADRHNRVIIAKIDDSFSLYSPSGAVLLSEKGRLGDFSADGWAIIYKEDRKPYCFVNVKGEKGIMLSQYEDAEPFTDNLAMVRKGGKYGYIRPDGSIAIPFIYDDAKSFYDGVTMVHQGRMVGLINTRNEFILPLSEHSNVYVSSFSTQREYTINGQKYNSKGTLINENSTEGMMEAVEE